MLKVVFPQWEFRIRIVGITETYLFLPSYFYVIFQKFQESDNEGTYTDMKFPETSFCTYLGRYEIRMFRLSYILFHFYIIFS